jgi:hypothetical protein
MAFASICAQIVKSVPRLAGPFCHRIHGQIYHKTSALHPNQDETAKYAQLYILDTTEANDARMANPANSKYNGTVMDNLQTILRRCNTRN